MSREDRKWRADDKVRPNAKCPCGSGKKYKKCCGRIVVQEEKEQEPVQVKKPSPQVVALLASAMALSQPPVRF